MGPTIQIAFDAADPSALAEFWKEMLGYVDPPPPPGHDSWADWLQANDIGPERWNDVRVIVDPEERRPRIYIQRVPEPKSAKNRVHIDLNLGDSDGERAAQLEAAVAKAEGLGARRVWEKTEFGVHWVTLTDPEGNEFCMA